MSCNPTYKGKRYNSLEEIKDIIKKEYPHKEGIKIDELPITTTLNDLAEIMAYGNNKIILPGYKVEYSTPLGNKYDTLEEVNNEIRGLADANVEVDLSGIKVNKTNPKVIILQKNLISITPDEYRSYDKKTSNNVDINLENNNTAYIYLDKNNDYNVLIKDGKNYFKTTLDLPIRDNIISVFIEKNKEYEQSKEIIEQWKKENNIQYDPEEVYSRGNKFYSEIGAYSDQELDLLLQNVLLHIKDNQKSGGNFDISAYTSTKPLKHLIRTGVRFVIYPKSEHIKWAAPTDVHSGSVWDAHEKVSKDKKSELLGVSFTKAPALSNINEVSPNLADIIDNLSHVHNEAGLELTLSNFEIEFDENIDYSTKQIINSVNKILQQKRLQEIDNFINTLEKQC